jgi:Domain of unknown function (DUF4160)
MPVVFREVGYTFYFYSDEGDPREPLHIHVRGKGCDAKIWVQPDVAVQTSYGLNAHELAKIVRMVERKAKLIESVWHEHFSN